MNPIISISLVLITSVLLVILLYFCLEMCRKYCNNLETVPEFSRSYEQQRYSPKISLRSLVQGFRRFYRPSRRSSNSSSSSCLFIDAGQQGGVELRPRNVKPPGKKSFFQSQENDWESFRRVKAVPAVPGPESRRSVANRNSKRIQKQHKNSEVALISEVFKKPEQNNHSPAPRLKTKRDVRSSPLNLFDTDRVVPPDTIHKYPFLHEIHRPRHSSDPQLEVKNLFTLPNLSSSLCKINSSDDPEIYMNNFIANYLNTNTNENYMYGVFKNRYGDLFGVEDQLVGVHKQQSASDENCANRYFEGNQSRRAFTCGSQAPPPSLSYPYNNHRDPNVFDSNASIVSSLLSKNVNGSKELIQNAKLAILPPYSMLPPPTYFEAVLNEHIDKQREIIARRKRSFMCTDI